MTGQGRRLWRFDYRFGGKRLTLSLGAYPDLGLSAAPQTLQEARTALAMGQNPGILIRLSDDCIKRVPGKLPIVYYVSGNGREPVREWLRSLDDDNRRAIGSDLFAVQMGWPLGFPLCRSLGKGFWEARCRPLIATLPAMRSLIREPVQLKRIWDWPVIASSAFTRLSSEKSPTTARRNVSRKGCRGTPSQSWLRWILLKS